uniref:Uncharacterized protein n=1 Tax=Panagrolaimus sp. PS1159 TaxID=55785 RepID=A0AC35GTE8_9BILA
MNCIPKLETLQLESLVTIKNLAKDYSNVNLIEYLIEENELLKKLLKPLLSENVEICEQAISLIQELCENSAFLELLSSENCCIRFKAASLLNKIDSDIKISDIYKPEGPVFKTEKIFDVNKISNLSAFFEYMKNPSHVLQHSACCCLNAFLSAIEGRSAFRKLFIELNTQINVAPLVALLSSPKIKVLKAALILVDALVCAYSGNKKQFLQAGALRALALQLQYPKRRKLVAAGIHNFSKHVVQVDAVSTHRTESIQKIIKFLIQILRRKDSEAFECALIALKNFVLEPCYRDFCIHAGIFDPLIKAIQNEPPNQLFIHELPWFLSTL